MSIIKNHALTVLSHNRKTDDIDLFAKESLKKETIYDVFIIDDNKKTSHTEFKKTKHHHIKGWLYSSTKKKDCTLQAGNALEKYIHIYYSKVYDLSKENIDILALQYGEKETETLDAYLKSYYLLSNEKTSFARDVLTHSKHSHYLLNAKKSHIKKYFFNHYLSILNEKERTSSDKIKNHQELLLRAFTKDENTHYLINTLASTLDMHLTFDNFRSATTKKYQSIESHINKNIKINISLVENHKKTVEKKSREALFKRMNDQAHSLEIFDLSNPESLARLLKLNKLIK